MADQYDNAGKIVSTTTNGERAKRKAKNKSKRAQMKGWDADLRVLGNPAIKSKSTVTLEKCGSILNGDWRVSSVKHEISESGYTCSLKIIRPEGQAEKNNTTVNSNSNNQNVSNNGMASGNNDDDSIIVNVG